jgi:disulfide bond formation protein DsbB
MNTPEPPRTSSHSVSLNVVWPPFLVALLAVAGSLWLSIGMGLKACPFCFYQRTFVMGVVAVFAIGLLSGRRHWGVLNVLALPLVVAGLGVAVVHEYLELNGKLECPGGVVGIGTAPQQSLAVLIVLFAVVVIGLVSNREPSESAWLAAFAAVVVGLLLAWGAIVSAPPMPPAPSKAYETPLDMCRPPFRSP